jgi:hypothetical protein
MQTHNCNECDGSKEPKLPWHATLGGNIPKELEDKYSVLDDILHELEISMDANPIGDDHLPSGWTCVRRRLIQTAPISPYLRLYVAFHEVGHVLCNDAKLSFRVGKKVERYYISNWHGKCNSNAAAAEEAFCDSLAGALINEGRLLRGPWPEFKKAIQLHFPAVAKHLVI